jgi:hypothetical protein
MFLPLYDVVHLAGVLARGHAPTGGEMAWALVDGCFVVADVLSLSALQPGAAAASEAARAELKATARAAARGGAREAVERAAPVAGRAATGWAVRAAGGTYRLLRRLPEALPRMSLEQVSRVAGPFCARAGMRLSGWGPVRLARDGVAVVVRVPSDRWMKYVGLNAAQAGVGAVGIRKMEEYLGSGSETSAR